MLLKLNRYDLKLEYVPGKELLIADALSRAQSSVDTFDDTFSQEPTVNVSLLTQASPTKWQEIVKMTEKDPELQDVLFHIKNGWPERSKTRPAAQPYWHCKEELYTTKDGIICRGQRLVVPASLRKDIMKKLHVSHKGIVSSKAREYFYWTNINKDVEEYVSKCAICQKYQQANQKEVLLDCDLPERPWQKVARDFFYLKGQQYLLMIDYFSKYVELKPLKNITAQAVMIVMKSIFATHGIPEKLITDGGPPYNSEALRKFLEEWGVMHNITSPHFPRANGQIERSVQTLKKSLSKAAEEGKDLYIVLLDYRIQPAKDLPSPAELLMGRRLRSFLPSHPKALQPKFQIKGASRALEKRQMVQKKYANKHATQLPKLHENDKVWFKWKIKEPWKQGMIMKTGPQPRSYVIKAKDGTVYRRNRHHIRKDKSTCEMTEWNRTAEDLFGLDQSTLDQPVLVDNDRQDPPKDQKMILLNILKFQEMCQPNQC
ncbi:uncharacterized protein K02A2.6-like [Stegodyphus dumicola]|uniref:uncharacterized protein K02A2.6-like n=1 Tax=Stegodyphus dumicola TaxID=202533 RepID=UPI0015AD165D|nr:uncharacterized protein K02A2.6-like [Stegodyphus dumicola]